MTWKYNVVVVVDYVHGEFVYGHRHKSGAWPIFQQTSVNIPVPSLGRSVEPARKEEGQSFLVYVSGEGVSAIPAGAVRRRAVIPRNENLFSHLSF